jgi:TonB family protein
MATGVNMPKAINTPGPQVTHNRPKPKAVWVEVVINPDGSVTEASVQGHPSPDIAQSALDAVKKWKFEPARLLGVPVAMTLNFKLEFRDK